MASNYKCSSIGRATEQHVTLKNTIVVNIRFLPALFNRGWDTIRINGLYLASLEYYKTLTRLPTRSFNGSPTLTTLTFEK